MKAITQTPLDRLRHHVTGAIERGEAEAIVEQTAAPPVAEQEEYDLMGEPCGDCQRSYGITQAVFHCQPSHFDAPVAEQEQATTRPWAIGEGKFKERFLQEPGGKIVCYLRKHSAFDDDDQDLINGEFIIRAVNAYDDYQKVVEAAKELIRLNQIAVVMNNSERAVKSVHAAYDNLKQALESIEKGR